MIAQVIPVQRLPAGHQWFDYLIPPELNIRRGNLVEINFRQRNVTGLVWGIVDKTSERYLKPVLALRRQSPVMTDWQYQVFTATSELFFTSLGHVVNTALPVFTKRKNIDVRDSASKPGSVKVVSNTYPEQTTWWYQHRSQALDWLKNWILTSSIAPRLIIVPNYETGTEIQLHLGADAATVYLSSKLLTPAQYRTMYEGILSGAIRRIIGTTQSLLLPFPIKPEVLIDQEEHPQHKLTTTAPRIDPRVLLQQVLPDHLVTTPMPSLWWYSNRHPSPSDSTAANRQLLSLDEPGSYQWVTSGAETALEKITVVQGRGLVIVPDSPTRQAWSCNDCHEVFRCPRCLRSGWDLHQESSLACRFCGAQTAWPVPCPRCAGSNWRHIGFDTTRYLNQIRRRFAKLPIHTTKPGSAGLSIGRYRDLNWLAQGDDWQFIMFPHGDHLLQWPDYSVEERAWCYLHRLEAAAPTAEIIIQTFNPTQDFWQDWATKRIGAWYEREVQARMRWHLPPGFDQWLVRIPTVPNTDLAKDKIAEITALDKPLDIMQLPPRQRRISFQRYERMVLTAREPKISISDLIDWTLIFPYPWQVDPHPLSWQD